jgi:hypothetical protein
MNNDVRLGIRHGFGRLRRVAVPVGAVKLTVDLLQLQLSYPALAGPFPRWGFPFLGASVPPATRLESPTTRLQRSFGTLN